MKIIWKIKRKLLRLEDRLIRKRYKEGIIGYGEYHKRMLISADRWCDICNQGEKNGWYYD